MPLAGFHPLRHRQRQLWAVGAGSLVHHLLGLDRYTDSLVLTEDDFFPKRIRKPHEHFCKEV